MPGEAPMLSLSDIINAVIEEVVEGVHRAQLAQDDDARELAAIAALDPAEVAEKLVPEAAAAAWCDRLLANAEAAGGWPRASAVFLRKVLSELDLRLIRDRDFDRWGLTEAGRLRVVAAARINLAAGQLESVRRLLREGAPRVRVTCGEVVMRLELQTQSPAPAPAPAAATRAAPASRPVETKGPRAPAEAPIAEPLPLAALRLAAARPSIRILARPTRKEDAVAGPVFGEIKLSFSI